MYIHIIIINSNSDFLLAHLLRCRGSCTRKRNIWQKPCLINNKISLWYWNRSTEIVMKIVAMEREKRKRKKNSAALSWWNWQFQRKFFLGIDIGILYSQLYIEKFKLQNNWLSLLSQTRFITEKKIYNCRYYVIYQTI